MNHGTNSTIFSVLILQECGRILLLERIKCNNQKYCQNIDYLMSVKSKNCYPLEK